MSCGKRIEECGGQDDINEQDYVHQNRKNCTETEFDKRESLMGDCLRYPPTVRKKELTSGVKIPKQLRLNRIIPEDYEIKICDCLIFLN